MSLWLFSEDGLTLVDVTRPQSMIRAWRDDADSNRAHVGPSRWIVGIPTSGVTLASFAYNDETPVEHDDGAETAEKKARAFLRNMSAQLNAGSRRPGEAPQDVAGRFGS